MPRDGSNFYLGDTNCAGHGVFELESDAVRGWGGEVLVFHSTAASVKWLNR
jgi:hypothetical protein